MDEQRQNRGLLHLVRWCALPTRPHELFQILKGLTEDELLLAATKLRGAVGRIAWAEFARRVGYFDFEISIATSAGRLDVSFEAKAPPIHNFPQFSS